MECNKDAAKSAMDIAEKKLSENDYIGAKKFTEKAQSLYPNLEGLKQVLMMIDVYMIASKKINGIGDSDWYGILGVDPLADDEAVKKQYKKLALLLHPDKNKRKGAEEAFKLVSEAWCVLSDKVKRVAYDQKRKFGMQRPPNPQNPACNNQRPTNTQRSASCGGNQNARPGMNPTATFTKPAPARKGVPFWTMCNNCKLKCTYLREYHLNKPVFCPNCGQTFIATEINPWTHAPPPPPPAAAAAAAAQYFATEKNTNGSLFNWKVCIGCKKQFTYTKPSGLLIPCPNCGKICVATTKTPSVSTKKNTNGASSSWTPVASPTPKTSQASAKSQATNTNTNGASFSTTTANATASAQSQQTANKSTDQAWRKYFPSATATPQVRATSQATNSNTKGASSSFSPKASATPETTYPITRSQTKNNNANGASSSSSPTANATPQASAQNQSTNGKTETTSSWIFTAPSVSVTVNAEEGAYPNFTVSTSSQPQQQNQSTGQNTSGGGTHSEASNTSSSIKVTVNWNCSYKVTRNADSTTFQAGGRAKRAVEESQENTAFKKPRRLGQLCEVKTRSLPF